MRENFLVKQTKVEYEMVFLLGSDINELPREKLKEI